MYKGFPAGSRYDLSGGNSNVVCMHSDPQALSGASSGEGGAGFRNLLYGSEYEVRSDHDPAFKSGHHDYDAACVVCQRSDVQQTYVQWGRSTSCSNGHTTLYSGAAMGPASNQHRAERCAWTPSWITTTGAAV